MMPLLLLLLPSQKSHPTPLTRATLTLLPHGLQRDVRLFHLSAAWWLHRPATAVATLQRTPARRAPSVRRLQHLPTRTP